MSQKSFSAFRAKLDADESLREEMSRALGPNGTTEDVVAFARARGYDFNPEELKTALELSDDELDSVSGGLLACATGQHIKKAVIEV